MMLLAKEHTLLATKEPCGALLFYDVWGQLSIAILIDKMHNAGNTAICAQLHSPVELRISNSEGEAIGVIDGKIVKTFPLAVVDKEREFVKILAAQEDNYTYEVVGKERGNYGLDLVFTHGDEKTIFEAQEIPIKPKEIYTLTVDEKALQEGRDAVLVKIDSDGDGVSEKSFSVDSTFTKAEYSEKIKTSTN